MRKARQILEAHSISAAGWGDVEWTYIHSGVRLTKSLWLKIKNSAPFENLILRRLCHDPGRKERTV